MYRMSCNTCKCGDNNRLICTKMACLESAILKKKITKHSIRTGRQGTEEKHKKKLNNKEKARKIKKLPKLPEGDCVPGRVYAKGCNKCFCNNQKYAVCTVTCRDEDLLNNRLSDEDILEIETRSEDDLATLPHLGTECVPGQSHYVECNVCLCSERRDLICTRRYCLNMMSYSENLIDNYEGKPCVRDFKQFCVSCTCVNKKMTCKVLDNCNSIMTGKQLLSDGNKVVKLALNAAKDQCTPNVIYKVHCNDCYCQPEGGLRCTQKMCLTYSQIKDLQEREVYLEKYGL